MKNKKEWLTSETLKNQVAQSLPKAGSVDKFLRCLFTQIQKNPKIMNCSQDSLYSAIITCGQLGIEPDGRRAHLIPYGNVCTVIIDYKGLIELVRRSGDVESIRAETVCEEDFFAWENGAITHRVDWRHPRGQIQAVYAEARLRQGEVQTAVMTVEEVEKVRQASRAAETGPWKDHWGEMAKKTAVRRLCKMLPLSPEAQEQISMDDDQFIGREMKQAEAEAAVFPTIEAEDEVEEQE